MLVHARWADRPTASPRTAPTSWTGRRRVGLPTRSARRVRRRGVFVWPQPDLQVGAARFGAAFTSFDAGLQPGYGDGRLAAATHEAAGLRRPAVEGEGADPLSSSRPARIAHA